MPKSLFSYAMDALFTGQSSVVGEKIVKIDGKEYPALITRVVFNSTAGQGGTAEKGQLDFVVTKEAMPNQPDNGTYVEGEGMTLQVDEVISANNLVWEVHCTDFAAEG